MINKIKMAAGNAWQGFMNQVLQHKALIIFGLLAIFAAFGVQAALPTVTDITAMVDDGTTVFTAVSVLVIAMVGFFILIKIVKGIRK